MFRTHGGSQDNSQALKSIAVLIGRNGRGFGYFSCWAYTDGVMSSQCLHQALDPGGLTRRQSQSQRFASPRGDGCCELVIEGSQGHS